MCFIPFLGGVHLFDWDEVNFAEIAREMIIRGDWSQITINYEPFFEKPPFFFWLQALSMSIFGIGEFAARFPNALCGLITLATLIHYGRRISHYRFGLLWAGLYLCSLLPHLYFRSGIIDPWFNLFILIAILEFFLAGTGKRIFSRGIIVSGLALGLAILTKGQVALIIAGGLMLLSCLWHKQKLINWLPHLLSVTFLSLFTAGLWFGYELLVNGPEYISAFISYQWDLLVKPGAGHSGFPGYHIVVLFFGCFPASILCLNSLAFGRDKASKNKHWSDRMRLLIILILVIFTLVQSKIVHYSSMAYFPITFLAALSMEKAITGEEQIRNWQKILLYLTGAFIAIVFLLFSFLRPEMILNYFGGNAELQAVLTGPKAHWYGIEWIPGILLSATLVLFYFLYRKKKILKALVVLVIGLPLVLESALYLFIPKIENYSQKPLVRFFEENAGRDASIATFEFKSYVPYYYGEVMPGTKISREEIAEILNGNSDRPLYLAVKFKKANKMADYRGIEELYREGNFIFYKTRFLE